MEKRTLLAIVLAIIVLIVYQFLVPAPKPPQIDEEKKVEKVLPEKKKDAPLKEKIPLKEKRAVPIEVVEEKLINIEAETLQGHTY